MILGTLYLMNLLRLASGSCSTAAWRTPSSIIMGVHFGFWGLRFLFWLVG
jgi:hypothetical protein